MTFAKFSTKIFWFAEIVARITPEFPKHISVYFFLAIRARKDQLKNCILAYVWQLLLPGKKMLHFLAENSTSPSKKENAHHFLAVQR
jgi:hypothetical protein